VLASRSVCVVNLLPHVRSGIGRMRNAGSTRAHRSVQRNTQLARFHATAVSPICAGLCSLSLYLRPLLCFRDSLKAYKYILHNRHLLRGLQYLIALQISHKIGHAAQAKQITLHRRRQLNHETYGFMVLGGDLNPHDLIRVCGF